MKDKGNKQTVFKLGPACLLILFVTTFPKPADSQEVICESGQGFVDWPSDSKCESEYHLPKTRPGSEVMLSNQAEGYKGQYLITCQENGEWKGSEVFCESVDGNVSSNEASSSDDKKSEDSNQIPQETKNDEVLSDNENAPSSEAENLDYRQLYFEMISTASALGAANGELCEKLGNRSQSHDLLVDSLSNYHQSEIEHIEKMKSDFNKLETKADELLQNESDNLQLEAIGIQKASKQLELDGLIGENGKVPRRKELLSKLKDVEIAGLREYDFFQEKLHTCRKNIDRSISVAKKGCERYAIIEECDEEGKCTTRKEPDPVEGSCEAETNLPHLNNIVESYHDHYLQILPSTLQQEGFENLIEKYNRYYSSSMVPEGDWKPNAGNCLNLLTDLYKDTGVVCQSISEDGKDRAKWDIPSKGDHITDMYEAFLGRLPDEGGLNYHKEDYEMFLQDGHTKDEALRMVRDSFIKSAEYRGVERTEVEQKRADQFLAKNNYSGEICTTLSCQSKNPGPDQITQDRIAKTLKTVNEVVRPEMFTITDEEREYLQSSTLEKIRQSDLVIGESYNRITILEGIHEIGTKLNEKDLEKAEVVLSQVEDLEKLYDELEKLQDSNNVSGRTLSQNENNSQQEDQNGNLTSISSENAIQQSTREPGQRTSTDSLSKNINEKNSENSKTFSTQVSGIKSHSGGTSEPLGDQESSSTSVQKGLERITELKSGLGNNNAISSSKMTRSLKNTRKNAENRAKKLNKRHLDRQSRLSSVNKAFSRPGSESRKLFSSKMNSGYAKNKGSYLGQFSKNANRKTSSSSLDDESSRRNRSITRRYGSRSSRSPSSVKSSRSTRRHQNEASPDGASREKQVAQIYKDLKDSGLYRPGTGVTSGEVNPRNQDLFKIISRRYMVSGLKRLQDLED